MSQYDFPTLLPLTHNGTDLSNFLNAWEPALLSSHRGTSRPTYAVAGMVWIDTSVAGTETVTFYDGTHDVPLFSIDSATGNVTFTGGSVAGGITYKGEVDPTVTAPASPVQGDMYVIANDGVADASYTGIAGDEVRENDVIFWDGTEYKYLVEQAPLEDYFPITGGTLEGDLSFSKPSILQPFTTIVPTSTYARLSEIADPNGGLDVEGFSGGAVGVRLLGHANSPSIVTNAGVFHFDARRGNGSGGDAPLAAADTAFSIFTDTVWLASVNGAGTQFLKGGVSTGGETAPDSLLGGICVNTGSSLGYAQTFKSDVAHGMTSICETDTYGILTQTTTSSGNFSIVGFSTGPTGLTLSGYATTSATAFSLSAAIRFRPALKSGTTVTTFAANENLISFGNNSTVVGVIKGSGTYITAGSVATGSEAAPDVDLGGICINHGALDGYAFTIKNSDIAHPYTTVVETDTYFTIGKRDNLMGGASFQAMSEDRRALLLNGYCAANTTDMSLEGMLTFRAAITDAAGGVMAAGSTSNLFAFRNNASNIMSLRADGMQYNLSGLSTGGELLPDTSAGGLCLQQNAQDGVILSMKSTDVAHGVTGLAETDTYAFFMKADAASGGLRIEGLTTTAIGVFFGATATTPATSNGGYGVFNFNARKTNVATVQAIANNENLAVFQNNNTNVFMIRGDGAVRATGNFTHVSTTSTGVGQLNFISLIPDAVGNRGGFGVANTSGGSLGGLAVEVQTVGNYPLSQGRLDLWVQNAGTTQRVLSSTGTGQLSTRGELAPDVDPGGICLNHDTNDGNILTFKNSDVAHPFTATAETDTYAQFGKRIANDGGLWIRGMSENTTPGITITSRTQTAVALGTDAPISFTASKSNGSTGESSYAATESILSVRNGSTFVMQLIGNGALYTLGGMSTGGELAPDVSAGGLCVQQNAATGVALSLKSTSVAHPFTTNAETDTYGYFARVDNTNGGVKLRGLASGTTSAVMIEALQQTGVTSGAGAFSISAYKSNGTTGVASISATENVLTVFNGATQIFTIKGNGDVIAAGSIGGGGSSASSISNGTSSVGIPVANDAIVATTAGAERLRIMAGGALATGGETAPDVDAGGLCLQQNALDFNILTFKSTDIAHGMTTVGETDTFFIARKYHATQGGVFLAAFSSGARGMSQYGLITTETTTFNSEGALVFQGSTKTGTTVGAMSDAANLAIFTNSGAPKVWIKGRGDIYTTGLISTGGEIAPDCAVGGLCLNQGATSADILTCKASAVNHPFTIFAENDTYARLTRVVTAGGLSLGGFATGATAFNVWAFATAPNTTGIGVVHFTAAKSNGTTGIADLAANENAFSVYNNSTALFTLKGNGAAAVAGPVSAGAGSNLPLGVNNQTGTTYTLALTDAGQNVTMNNASANTLTIPANASVAFPIGTTIKITQLGAGQTTVAITTDTLNVAATFQLKLAERYSEAVLTKLTATMWVLSGDLALV